MADETKKQTVTLEQLMVSNLAMADATMKLLIQKGDFTDEEFKAQLGAEKANYLAVLKRLHRRVEAVNF
jgi:transcription initiation factor IIE alpha subunit